MKEAIITYNFTQKEFNEELQLIIIEKVINVLIVFLINLKMILSMKNNNLWKCFARKSP